MTMYLRTVVLIATLCASAFAQNTNGTPEERKLDWKTLGEWRGYSLNGHEIQSLHISDPFQSFGQMRELVELEVTGPLRTWAIRCTLSQRAPVEAACEFVPSDGGPASVLVLDGDAHGDVLGQATLRVAYDYFNTEELRLYFSRPDGTRVAAWTRGLFETRRRLVMNQQTREEEELMTLCALALLPATTAIADSPGQRLDSYPRTAASPREARGQQAALQQLEARGASKAASLLKLHLDDLHQIHREGGAYITRHPGTARILGGLYAGPSLHTPGVSVSMSAGFRTNRISFALTMGLHVGEVRNQRFATLDGGIRASAGFSFGLQIATSRSLVGDLEGTLGLEIAARVRFVELNGWTDLEGATQAGGSLAPFVGLQYPVWNMNKFGSRMLLTLEGGPEGRLWTKPGITAPPTSNAVEPLRQGLSDSDWAVRTRLGIRFEL
jgi:hypothetical protein